MRELLVDLQSIAPDERGEPISRRLQLLDRTAGKAIGEEHDRRLTERIDGPHDDSDLAVRRPPLSRSLKRDSLRSRLVRRRRRNRIAAA